MTMLLNIGLRTNDGRDIFPADAIDAIQLEGPGEVVAWEVHPSDTEPTLVAEVVNNGGAKAALFRVAQRLQQDCVAAYVPRLGTGALIGPATDKWGEFNPAYFILLDGRRAAE